MMKRRVASQLEDIVHMFATLKAAIKVLPMIEEHVRLLGLKETALKGLLELVSPPTARTSLVGIGQMLGCDIRQDDLSNDSYSEDENTEDDGEVPSDEDEQQYSNPIDDDSGGGSLGDHDATDTHKERTL